MASIMLTKHHGLGNDFLITVDPLLAISGDDALRWCDRRRGVGADGLIAARRHGEDPNSWKMELWNADGSRAELSGNGLCCLGQALVLHHDDGASSRTFQVETDAGLRQVDVHPDRDSDTDRVTVDMGPAEVGPPPSQRWAELGVEVERQLGVDMGNPHLVALVKNLDSLDVAAIGSAVEADYPDGLNVEFIEVRSRSLISLRVWERGAGITEACGSGACAAAYAAAQWDMIDQRVDVAMPGGSAIIDMIGDSVRLTGPATFVAVVEIEQS